MLFIISSMQDWSRLGHTEPWNEFEFASVKLSYTPDAIFISFLMLTCFSCVQMLSGMISVGTVDCKKHHSFCQSEGVRAYPEIRLYPQNSNRRDQYQYERSENIDTTVINIAQEYNY